MFIRYFRKLKGSKLLDEKQKSLLLEWCKKDSGELIYSATRDGFTASAFHGLCDDDMPTLVVIKSKDGYLFGGYATESWDGTLYDAIQAKGSFTFTLTNPKNLPATMFPIIGAKEMYCDEDYGPVLGVRHAGGHGFRVVNKSHINSSVCYMPCYVPDTKDCWTFHVAEIEVFLLE